MAFLDQFHYQLLGNPSGPKLVFLHGLMGSGANWRKITNQFEKDYHILLYDQRGHGRSFQPEGGYRPDDYADDLTKILDELGWERIFLVGHSMGGRNAIIFSSLWPQRVIALVIEDIGVEPDPRNVQKYEKLLGLVPTPFEKRSDAKQFLLEVFPGLLKQQQDALTLANYFYANMAERDDGKTDWRFSKEGILESVREWPKQDWWTIWKSLKMPILLIRGSDSPDFAPAIYEKMLAANAHVKGVVIAPSGHWVHHEQPDKFTQELRLFLNSVSSV